ARARVLARGGRRAFAGVGRRARGGRLATLALLAGALAPCRPPLLLGPARALEMDGRRRERLADGALATQRTGRWSVGVDAVDPLEPPTTGRAVVVVQGHRAMVEVSRGGGACRTWGSRTPARERRRNRSARRPDHRDRRPGRVARWRRCRWRTG